MGSCCIRTIIWLCCVGIVLSAVGLQAADLDKFKASEKIEKLLDLIHISELEAESDALTQKYIDEYKQEVAGYIKAAFPDAAGETKRKIDAHVEVFWEDLRTSMGEIGTIGDHLKDAYAESFSEDELDGVIAYYSTPVGAKDAKMKKRVAIEYNRLWMDRFTSQYQSRVEALFKTLAKMAKEKGKQGA